MEDNPPCPHTQIDFNPNREIINTDNLTFPWKQDPKGYFLVKIEGDVIYCGFVTLDHQMILEFRGLNPDKMIKEIVERKICNDHNLAYISQELMIAFHCIKNNLPYNQR